MRYQKGNAIVALMFLCLWAFGVIGWVWNIVKIVGSSFDVITGMLVVRVIGIFVAPIGCILGYF